MQRYFRAKGISRGIHSAFLEQKTLFNPIPPIQLRYIPIESGEALTLARGTSKTINGKSEIPLPEHFSLVTSSEAPITVLLTPQRAPVVLYTMEQSKDRVVVGMKDSDYFEFGDVEFAFQVTGVRDGFEDEEIIVDIDKLYDEQDKAGKGGNAVQERIRATSERMRESMKSTRERKDDRGRVER